jgi:hypothetical protein
LVFVVSMTKGANIPIPVPVPPTHNEIGRGWNELVGKDSPSLMSDVGLEGDDGPISGVGLDGDGPMDDVGLEGGGEEEGEAGGDMFLRMAV